MLGIGFVRVSADGGGDACCGWVEVERGQVMEHIEAMASELNEFGWRKLRAETGAVDVAANGSDGSDGAEGVEDFIAADVAGVEDVIDAAQGADGFGPQETVRV